MISQKVLIFSFILLLFSSICFAAKKTSTSFENFKKEYLRKKKQQKIKDPEEEVKIKDYLKKTKKKQTSNSREFLKLKQRLEKLEDYVYSFELSESDYFFFNGLGYGSSSYTMVNRFNESSASVAIDPYPVIFLENRIVISAQLEGFLRGNFAQVQTLESSDGTIPATTQTLSVLENGVLWTTQEDWLIQGTIGLEQKLFFVPSSSEETSLAVRKSSLPSFTFSLGSKSTFESSYFSFLMGGGVILGEKNSEMTIDDGYRGQLVLEYGSLERGWKAFVSGLTESQNTSLTTQTKMEGVLGFSFSY